MAGARYTPLKSELDWVILSKRKCSQWNKGKILIMQTGSRILAALQRLELSSPPAPGTGAGLQVSRGRTKVICIFKFDPVPNTLFSA